ncbi:hypothetical protein UFOVP255_11 [uncultured Caudovirales phage]|uniref:Uncharacterized protein n=1 Tax=uncultured Caudovirales phage TaxID=2100421 RepID=A0A6J5LD18_9CAUD|nr:hypothetical protein UFOVP255_11 [uncultured Caudovirales phage]
MKNFCTYRQRFFRNFMGFFIPKCFSEFKHCERMRFFANKIWNDFFKKIVHNSSRSEPLILKAPFFGVLASIFLDKNSSKSRMNPFHKTAIGIHDLKSGEIIETFSSFPDLDIDCTFSVNDSCKIGYLSICPHI